MTNQCLVAVLDKCVPMPRRMKTDITPQDQDVGKVCELAGIGQARRDPGHAAGHGWLLPF